MTKAGKPLTNHEISVRRWRKQHPEKITEYCQRYYAANKQKRHDYCTEKVTCECGTIVSRVNLRVHRKSKQHIRWAEIQLPAV